MSRKAIIVCRVSVQPTTHPSSGRIMSNDSQEFMCSKAAIDMGMKVEKVIKYVGSAYNKPPTELLSLVKSTKNKTLILANASRLSRNTVYFENIWKECAKRGHSILLANTQRTYDSGDRGCFLVLFGLVAEAEAESKRIGDNVRRTAQYKKYMKLNLENMDIDVERPGSSYAWLSRREGTQRKLLEDVERSKSIEELIKELATTGTSILRLRNHIRMLSPLKDENFEPFVVLEVADNGVERVVRGNLPYGYSEEAILSTLRTYGIKNGARQWSLSGVRKVLARTDDVEELTEEIRNL